MACELTKGRGLDCKDVIGGIRSVFFAQLDDTTITSSAGSVSDLDITTNVYKYNLVRATGSFTETVTASAENGTVFYEPSVNIKLHKLSVADRNEIKLLAQNRLVMFVETNGINANGKRVVFCLGAENGMELSTGTASSGVAFADMNGYDLTFVGMESEPALVVADYTDNALDNSNFNADAGLTITES